MKTVINIIILSVTFIVFQNQALASTKVIKIGSGNVLEDNFFIALKLCSFIKASNSGVQCDVVPTNGSVENVQLLQDGKIDFALVQSNIAFEAFTGTGFFENSTPVSGIRQVLKLHDNVFTVIAKDEERVKVLGDIDGKKISTGISPSASSLIYDEISKLYGFKNMPIKVELPQEEFTKNLCKDKIDVLIMMTGHPNAFISHVAHNCEIDFVTIEKAKIDQLLKDNGAFHKTTLKSGLYPGITEDQETVAAPIILISKDKMDAQLLKNFTDYFHKNIGKFKQAHPALYELNDEDFFSGFIIQKHNSF